MRPVGPDNISVWEKIPLLGKKSQDQWPDKPITDYVYGFVSMRSMHWQTALQFESGFLQKSPRRCKHCFLCEIAACLECFEASGSLSGIHLWVGAFCDSFCMAMKS
jgi:hypothetical protein